jgi:hypothetical protein
MQLPWWHWMVFGIVLVLLGEKYIQALDKLAPSGNSKIVLLPAYLQDAVKGVLGKTRSA